MTDGRSSIDLDRLLKLRLVVARHGETDCQGWWNTNGVLGSIGQVVYDRGFPRTARFAQARVVFAVARARTKELWNPIGCATLWNLPPDVEDAFEDQWQSWSDAADEWAPFFREVAQLKGSDLLDDLVRLQVVDGAEHQAARELKRSVDGRAVLLPGVQAIDDRALALLGAGFFRSEPRTPAIPYLRLGH